MRIAKVIDLRGAATFLYLMTSAAYAHDHTPLSFTVSQNEIIATGEIDSNSLDLFEDLMAKHPGIDILVLANIGGSVDDEANVEFARFVRELGLITRVPSNGLVASGGTDLFLAGVHRILEPGACIGVHSWAAEDFTATDLPRNDPEHDRYLRYYQDVKIDEAFYWFTLEAASANDMHWMTSKQVNRFGLTTHSAPSLGKKRNCNNR